MRVLAAIVAALAIVSCGPSAPTEAPADADEPRIVALSPAVAVMLVDLGLEDRIVGRHDYDLVLDPGVPKIGDQAQIDYEALLRAEPTHVYTQRGAKPADERLVSYAEDRGWLLKDYRLRTIDEIAAAYDDLALTFGAGGPASPIVTDGVMPEIDLDRLAARMPSEAFGEALRPIDRDLSAVGPVLLLGGVTPAAAFGPGSYHHEILVRLGAKPAIDEGGAWVELDTEDVLNLRPGGIVLIAPRAVGSDAAGATAADLIERLGVIGGLPIPAVEAERVALIDDPLAHLPSTSLIDVAGAVREILEGWASAGSLPSAP